MKKLVVLLCALLALGSSAQALEVSAPSALLMEKETGTVLFAKDEHAKLEPASVTKVMTLLLVMEAVDSGRVSLEDTVTGDRRRLEATGLFVAIGQVPRSELVANVLDLDEAGYITVDEPSTRTSVAGVFACGDAVDHTYRQAITAAGSGCRAALDAEHYLTTLQA